MEFGDSDTAKTNDTLETAIANEVDGIAMTVGDDDVFDEIVCKAMDAGIPVVLHTPMTHKEVKVTVVWHMLVSSLLKLDKLLVSV